MKAKHIFGLVKKVADEKGSLVLTILAGAGVITTAVLAGKAAIEIHEIKKTMDEKELEPEERREVIIHDVMPVLVPPIVSAAATIGCVVGAQAKNVSKITALTGAYAIKEGALKDLREEAKELLGEKKYSEMESSIAQKKVDKIDIAEDVKAGIPHDLFLVEDLTLGGEFYADIESIRRADLELREQMHDMGYATVNDLFCALGRKPIQSGDKLGWDWDFDRGVKLIHIDTALKNDTEPIITISYEPRAVR